MNRKLVVLALSLDLFGAYLGQSVAVPPAPAANEVAWSGYLAGTVGGEAEHRLPNGDRVDILTDEVAWEVEWCSKQDQSFGQAIRYAVATQRDPGVWLLYRKGDDEHYLRALATLTYLRGHDVPIAFRTTVVEAKP